VAGPLYDPAIKYPPVSGGYLIPRETRNTVQIIYNKKTVFSTV